MGYRVKNILLPPIEKLDIEYVNLIIIWFGRRG